MKYISDDEARAYTTRMIALLEGRTPIEVLGSTVPALEHLLEGVTESQTQYKPSAEKWSVRQIYAHLAEGEMMLSVRLRQIIAENGIGITAYSQDKWAAIGNYQARPCHESLALLTPIRSSNVTLLQSLTEDQFLHFGIHEERGRETVTDMIRIWAGHDLNHLKQIATVLLNSEELSSC